MDDLILPVNNDRLKMFTNSRANSEIFEQETEKMVADEEW